MQARTIKEAWLLPAMLPHQLFMLSAKLQLFLPSVYPPGLFVEQYFAGEFPIARKRLMQYEMELREFILKCVDNPEHCAKIKQVKQLVVM
jgi:hypothetical protein